MPLVQDVIRELLRKIDALIDIGLGYLSLDRPTETLSGGETQRIKIAKFLTSALVDMVYILDEPSVGLHPHDIELIKRALLRLKEKGNTILIVEHNPALIALGDYIVEVGPGAGTTGGHITFTGTYPQLLASQTLTGRLLKQRLTFGNRDRLKRPSICRILPPQPSRCRCCHPTGHRNGYLRCGRFR